jgi:cyanophycinase
MIGWRRLLGLSLNSLALCAETARNNIGQEIGAERQTQTKVKHSHFIIAGGGTVGDEVFAPNSDVVRCDAPISIFSKETVDAHGYFAECFRQTGKESPTTVVITGASGQKADETGARYISIINYLSPTSKVNYIGHIGDYNDKDNATLISRADLILLPGGDQDDLWDALQAGKLTLEAFMKAAQEGNCVIGTNSASTALIGKIMPTGGRSHEPEKVRARMNPGLAIFPHTIYDMHLGEFERLGRLLTMIEKHPELTGVGVDTYTSLSVNKNGIGKVIGAGNVYAVLNTESAPEMFKDIFPAKRQYTFGNGLGEARFSQDKFIVYRFPPGTSLDLNKLYPANLILVNQQSPAPGPSR